MRVLIACEFSGIVRDAFLRHGHDAWSCDLLPTEIEGNHIQDDVMSHICDGWDLMLAFPPCTYLCCSGARWFKDRQIEQWRALIFVAQLMTAPIPRIAIENPVGVISTRLRKPDQIIHPFHFGYPESKATCLWLKNLPPLMCSFSGGENIIQRVHLEPPSADRWKNRSRTYIPIAEAMAEQWGSLLRG